MLKENIIEIFSSIQGEGKYVGCRQVFVRFEGCNLDCRYCDTENAPGAHAVCQAETAAGSRRFTDMQNPLTAEQVAAKVQSLLDETPHQAVSFTGGEPLLHDSFIREVADLLQGQTKIFLETNGTLYEKLTGILDITDIISMDIKLPSVLSRPCWDRHRRFLELAAAKDLYVKLVVSDETSREEFKQAVELLRETAPEAMLIIQPVTPRGGVQAAAPEKVLACQDYALSQLKDVRVIPQTHKMINQL